MDFCEAQSFINSFSRSGTRVNDLLRISRLLEALDNPQDKLEFIHIAGTNGKGSTLEYISDILEKSARYNKLKEELDEKELRWLELSEKD